MKIYQFENISVEIAGAVQSLVQSVTVNSDRGLDFVTLNNQTTQDVIRKGQLITIQINYLGNGSFFNPTAAGLNDAFGDIKVHRLEANDADLLDTQTIVFKDCILIGTSSSVDANSSPFGSASATYQARYYALSNESVTSPITAQRPAITTHASTRQCYTPLQTNQITYSSTCTISRKYLYSPGRAKPTHLCIEYPIITTSTVGVVMYSGYNILATGEQGLCEGAASESSNAGIPNAYLESVDIEGGSAGSNDYQIINYTYKSTNNYGLTRLRTIT